MADSTETETAGGCLYDGTVEVQSFTPAELAEIEAVIAEPDPDALVPGGFRVITKIRSQNFNFTPNRRMRPPVGIVLHHTGGTFAGDLATLTKPASNPQYSVSANDYITKDGRIFELCEYPKRAWHAGKTKPLNGILDWNAHGWGVEIENLGKSSDPYPQTQIDAVVWRCRERRRVLGINDPKMLTRHRDISREGKDDPWDNFPYAEVRKRIFAAHDPTDAGAPKDEHAWPGREVSLTLPQMSGDDVRLWEQKMNARGWNLEVDGKYDENDRDACLRFQQRHNLKEDGIVGRATWEATFTAAPVPPTRGGPVTTSSLLIAPPRATLRQATTFLNSRPHGSFSAATVGRIAKLYFDEAIAVELDPLIAVSQMVLETGGLTSEWSQPPRRNPAGIGVTGQANAGLSFPNWPAAVRAHLGRLLAYALPETNETPTQEALVDEALTWRPLPDAYRGVAVRLKGLTGTWAMDPAYADSISRIANEIRDLS